MAAVSYLSCGSCELAQWLNENVAAAQWRRWLWKLNVAMSAEKWLTQPGNWRKLTKSKQ